MDTRTLLERIGGQAAIAKECEISESAVSQWATEDSLPKARQQYLRLAHPGDHWSQWDASRDSHTRAAAEQGAH